MVLLYSRVGRFSTYLVHDKTFKKSYREFMTKKLKNSRTQTFYRYIFTTDYQYTSVLYISSKNNNLFAKVTQPLNAQKTL